MQTEGRDREKEVKVVGGGQTDQKTARERDNEIETLFLFQNRVLLILYNISYL